VRLAVFATGSLEIGSTKIHNSEPLSVGNLSSNPAFACLKFRATFSWLSRYDKS